MYKIKILFIIIFICNHNFWKRGYWPRAIAAIVNCYHLVPTV
uniref:Uncharacterized protein n=1 Tax=Anguilla anguilla TaxID=7936 RepID=A0A0E9XLE6_ANGAN